MPGGNNAHLVDIIGISIGDDRALLGGSTAGVVGTEVLNDVVLDQGILGPSVDSKVAVAIWSVIASVLDHSIMPSALSSFSSQRDMRTCLKFLASNPYLQPSFHCQTR